MRRTAMEKRKRMPHKKISAGWPDAYLFGGCSATKGNYTVYLSPLTLACRAGTRYFMEGIE